MTRMIPLIALLCSLLALLLSAWIVVRAPHRIFWLISIISSGWSLFFGLVALVGVVAGIISVRTGAPVSGYIAIGSGTIACLISLYPLIMTLPVASNQGVNLSMTRYFTGTSLPAGVIVNTYPFSEVDGSPLSLDVYTTEGTAIRPAIVVVHGGSWNGGTRSDFPTWNTWLANQGYVVFDIDYRLAPQPNWQTATKDVQDAIRWIKARGDQFKIDPNRIALLGRSAGGHLALQAAYTAQDSSLGFADAQVQAVIGFYAPADLKWGYENPAFIHVNDGSAQLRAFTGGTPETMPEVYKQASPLTYVQKDTPPTLLIHGEKDQLVGTHHTVTLHRALLDQNGDPDRHRLLFIPYGQHGFDFNFNGWGSQVTQAVLLEYLEAHLTTNNTR